MEIKLNKSQKERLSEFISNIGIIFVATVITPVFSGTMVNSIIIIPAFILGLGFLIISLVILNK